MIEEGDGYHDPTLPPPDQAFAFMTAVQDSNHDRSLYRPFPKSYHRNKNHRLHEIQPQIHQGVSRIDWGKFRKKIHSLTRMIQPRQSDPLIQSDITASTQQSVEQAYFVSEGSLGIVDLAERFGLKQGDLLVVSIYDRLLLKQPRHIWISPRCKARCRWNHFNMSKTPESARRILQDRQEDLVHLLLCDALFQFQQWRNPECHTHLEQPDGSHMVYQPELQDVVKQTFRAKCDMCVAGQLRNPITGELLRKSAQVLTTSRLMCAMLDFHRCSKDHQHGLIDPKVWPHQLIAVH